MSKSKAEWVVMGGKSGEIGHCTRCGEGLTINLPQKIDVVTACMNAFVDAHADCPPGQYIEKPTLTPSEWLAGRDTGISSKTIHAVMTGGLNDWNGCPSDPSDFGRCYRLLKLFPAWRLRMGEVAARFPEWKGLVDHWDELTALYEEELPTNTAPKLYARMKELTRG